MLPEIKSSVSMEPLQKIRDQVGTSDAYLDEVARDTRLLLSNMKKESLTIDAKQSRFTSQARSRRLEVLERDRKVAQEQLKDISKRWTDTVRQKMPSDIHEHLTKQKVACDAVTKEKNKIISNLKQEINRNSLKFDELIQRHDGEMDRMVSCAREQMVKLSECYTKELTNIEMAMTEEWQQIFQKYHQQLTEAIQEMQSHSVHRFEKTRLICDKWEQELDELRMKKMHNCRAIDAQLERDVERLEQCLQNLKSALLLNEEKLDYSCQVLRSREEEHIKVKANQKRSLAKLNDVVAALKSSVSKVEHKNRVHLGHIDRDCIRIREQILNREQGFRQTEMTDNAKLEELWRLNDETARNLVDELLGIDRQICENILQISWQPPVLSFCTSRAAYKKCSAVTVKSQEFGPMAKRIRCATLFRLGILATRGRLLKRNPALKNVAMEDRKPRDLPLEVRRDILRILANEAAFLVSEPLRDMIAKIPTVEQFLVQLDSIFEALNIKNESEVDLLVRYVFDSCCNAEDVSDDNGHISPNLPPLTYAFENGAVLKAVNDFFEKKQMRCSLQEKLKLVNSLREGMSKRTDLDWRCADYWAQFANILPNFTEDLWEALSNKLGKLRQIKIEHCKVSDEIRQLQIQNEELRFLLSDCVEGASRLAQE